jgi:hypothetical protein
MGASRRTGVNTSYSQVLPPGRGESEGGRAVGGLSPCDVPFSAQALSGGSAGAALRGRAVLRPGWWRRVERRRSGHVGVEPLTALITLMVSTATGILGPWIGTHIVG